MRGKYHVAHAGTLHTLVSPHRRAWGGWVAQGLPTGSTVPNRSMGATKWGARTKGVGRPPRRRPDAMPAAAPAPAPAPGTLDTEGPVTPTDVSLHTAGTSSSLASLSAVRCAPSLAGAGAEVAAAGGATESSAGRAAAPPDCKAVHSSTMERADSPRRGVWDTATGLPGPPSPPRNPEPGCALSSAATAVEAPEAFRTDACPYTQYSIMSPVPRPLCKAWDHAVRRGNMH